jgi:acetamidase/formamidase
VQKINVINLPSFLRKTLKAFALKAEIRELGCELNRIGRSRNWQLKATFEQIQSIITFINESNEPSWQWLATLLSCQYHDLSHEHLVEVANSLSSISVASIMARTDCTIAQARKVLDEIEDMG